MDHISGNRFCGYYENSISNIIINGIYELDQYINIRTCKSLTSEEKENILKIRINNVKNLDKRFKIAKSISFVLGIPVKRENDEYIITAIREENQLEEKFAKSINSYELKSEEQNIQKSKEEYMNKAFIEHFPKDGQLKNNPLKIRLIPDEDAISWLYSENEKSKRVICTITVEPDWIHFDDYVNHGLIDIWDYAYSHPDDKCILLLQNINITVFITALTPLFDVLNNNRPQLPYSSCIGIPENLTIYCSLLPSKNKLAIPFDEKFLNLCDYFSKDTTKTIDYIRLEYCEENTENK